MFATMLCASDVSIGAVEALLQEDTIASPAKPTQRIPT